MSDQSKATVGVALAANVGVGLAKLVGGAITLSPSLLAEAAHSVADTLNEIFLLASLKKAERPADRSHPFGYGKERFFWSLLAAVGIFLSGAGFSILEGVYTLITKQREETGYAIVYVVLAISFVLEGASLRTALRQVRQEAAEASRPLLTFVRRSPDPTVKTVASEDSVAVIGVVFAFVGTLLHQLTGSAAYDAGASIAIGLLLGYVAFALGRDTKDLLIGESADPVLRLEAYRIIEADPGIVGVSDMLTMQLGPDSVLLAAHVDVDDRLNGGEVEQMADRIESELQRRLPTVRHVFLDPANITDEAAERQAGRLRVTEEEVAGLDGQQRVDDLKAITSG